MTADPLSRLPLSLSMDSSTPLYDQIETQLRQLIVSNMLAAGTLLPSVRALATSLGCSVITTRRAYQELEQQGLIRTLQGRGTLVAEVSDELREEYRLAPVEAALRAGVREAVAAGMSAESLTTLLHEILEEEMNRD